MRKEKEKENTYNHVKGVYHDFLFFGSFFQKIETNLNKNILINHGYGYYVYGY
tara:strand:- start:239 stop:397 length:159 start_codon:yes stop_codon:yes gene_type:complete